MKIKTLRVRQGVPIYEFGLKTLQVGNQAVNLGLREFGSQSGHSLAGVALLDLLADRGITDGPMGLGEFLGLE
jgi:hypothetical protein